MQDELGKFGWVVLPSTNSSSLNTSLTTIQWMKNPLVKDEAFEILTEKQLFDNIKKEIKEVSIKLN